MNLKNQGNQKFILQWMLTKGNDDKQLKHSKSNNIEIIIGNET